MATARPYHCPICNSAIYTGRHGEHDHHDPRTCVMCRFAGPRMQPAPLVRWQPVLMLVMAGGLMLAAVACLAGGQQAAGLTCLGCAWSCVVCLN